GGAGARAARAPAGACDESVAATGADRGAAVPPDRRRLRPAHADPAERPLVHPEHPRPAPDPHHGAQRDRLADLRHPVMGPLEARLARTQRGEPVPDRHGRAAAGLLRQQGGAGADPAQKRVGAASAATEARAKESRLKPLLRPLLRLAAQTHVAGREVGTLFGALRTLRLEEALHLLA